MDKLNHFSRYPHDLEFHVRAKVFSVVSSWSSNSHTSSRDVNSLVRFHQTRTQRNSHELMFLVSRIRIHMSRSQWNETCSVTTTSILQI